MVFSYHLNILRRYVQIKYLQINEEKDVMGEQFVSHCLFNGHLDCILHPLQKFSDVYLKCI